MELLLQDICLAKGLPPYRVYGKQEKKAWFNNAMYNTININRRRRGRGKGGKWVYGDLSWKKDHCLSTTTTSLAFPFPALTSKEENQDQEERTIPLPIDYYKVLGADTHFLADAIVRAYGSRINNPPIEGFSEEALHARQEILKGACETLADPDLRGDYNKGLEEDEATTLMIDVPWSKLSGALCLLQEVGECEIVLQVGEDLLQEKSKLSKLLIRDIVLAMALAYVELSRAAMAEKPPALLRSSEMLEMALKLIQDDGGSNLAPALQEQIDKTLWEMNPRCILELLSLPLTKEFEIQREEGLQRLRTVLWTVGEGGVFAPISGFSRDEFITEAYSFMTSFEQVAFFLETPKSHIPADSSEVYLAALAFVAEGFIAKKPHLIQEADILFSQMQQLYGSVSSIDGDSLEFAAERGLCALLLGELNNSYTILGLNNSSRDPSVDSNSVNAEEGDNLGGLCRLLENWLVEVVFPRFRNTRDFQFNLGDYYDDYAVLSYLERKENKGVSPRAAIAQLRASAGAALQTLQKVFPFGKALPSFNFKKPISDVESASSIGVSVTSPTNTISDDVNVNELSSDSNIISDDVNELSSDSSSADEADDETDLTEISSDFEKTLESVEDENNHSVSAVEVEIPSHQRLTSLQIITAGASLGALAFLGWRIFAPQYRQMACQRVSSSSHAISSSQESVITSANEEVPKMDVRSAEELVRRWQSAKAEALGPNHMLGQLHEVLDGEMLRSWTERAKDVANNGWHWEYELSNLNIDSVTINPDNKRVRVEATLQEAAHLYGSSNPEEESYLTTYTTRYELVFVDGNWKIMNGAILRT